MCSDGYVTDDIMSQAHDAVAGLSKGLSMSRGVGLVLLLVLALGLPSVLLAQSVDVPADYDTIQEAVDALASNPSLGDAIVIAPGTYRENVEIAAAVTLMGEETARTILVPDSKAQPIVSISNVENVTLRNLSFDEGDLALSVNNSVNVLVSNNVFSLHDQATAVTFDLASSASVVHNVFYGNDRGVVRQSDQINIRNNIFSDNTWAILGGEAQVEYNCFYNNEFNGVNGLFAVLNSNPLFVDPAKLDFHLREGSPCVDEGDGVDRIDDSVADIGAYGGTLADNIPFPVQGVTARDVTASEGSPAIEVSWLRNNSYFITHSSVPGGYWLYYDSDQAGVPYEGQDASQGNSPLNVGNVTSYRLSNLSVDSVIPMSPEITQVQPSNGQVSVTWSSVAGATGYQLHYGVASVNENTVGVGRELSYTVQNLTNGTTYLFSVSAKAQTVYYVALRAYDSTADANTSDYSAEVSVNMGGERISALSPSRSAIPELVVPIPDLPDEGCFIATAAFGYYSAPQVQGLRGFRDTQLKRHIGGRLFIKAYYTWSPALAEYVRQSEFMKSIVRLILAPLVLIAGLMAYWQVNLIIMLFVVVGMLRVFQSRGSANVRSTR